MKTSGIYRKEIFWHLMFWFLYVLIRVGIIQLYPGSILYRIEMELIELPLKMAALYFAIYVLIRRLLLQNQYLLFASAFVAYIVVIMMINRVEDYYITYPLIEDSVSGYTRGFYNLDATFLQSSITRHEDGFWDLGAAFLNLIYIYPVVGLGAAAYFAKGWYENHLKHERAQNEKLQAELKLLKDQLHPHFLFNTLNNIYSLSQAQSEKTSDMIFRLSHLLGFMLYEGNAPLISISKELEALKDYVELERLRLGSRLQLSYQTSGDIEGKCISPMLLFPFLENCFKHGCHKTMEKVWIDFNLTVEEDIMMFQIENSIPTERTTQPGNQSGMGLANVKRRLDLIYPGKYELTKQQVDSYLVKLKLKLS